MKFAYFLMYYAAGLLVAWCFFCDEELWQRKVSAHGPAIVAAVFACNLVWPLMATLIMARCFETEINRRQGVVRSHCAD